MSHEIRTPMNGVIGMTSLLVDSDLSDDQRLYAETIQQSAESLLTIINDILDFSKIEAGKLDIECIDFDIRVTIDDMNDVLAIKAQEKELEYICMIDPEIPSLLQGDPGRLRQILINLINNAIKFTSKGEVSLSVTLDKEEENEIVLCFSVKDTGIGIPKYKIDILFDGFTQVDSTTTRRFGGTGLGLAISKQLTGMMGGKIGVKSKEKEGSIFWFTLPLKKQDKPAEIYECSEDIQGKNVLVVDDNETNRKLLTMLLRSWECRYGEASNSKYALKKIRDASRKKIRMILL